MDGAELPPPVVTLSEAQAFVRVETGEEEAVLAGLVRTASALCEAFTGQAIVARPFSVEVPASSSWQRLAITPVRTITTVEQVDVLGVARALTVGAYAVDIDATGDGWIRVTGAAEGRLRVSGTAGLAVDQNEVPEPIRHGVLRLVAHLFASRDGAGGEAPAAVTALWRPYRRMRLS